MRRLFVLCLTVFAGLLASEANTAEAEVWASGASVISKSSGISELRPVGRAKNAPDKLRWYVTTPTTSSATNVETIEAQWTFAGGVPAKDAFFGVFSNIEGTGSISGAITSYTTSSGTTTTTGTAVTLPMKISNIFTRVYFPFTSPGS